MRSGDYFYEVLFDVKAIIVASHAEAPRPPIVALPNLAVKNSTAAVAAALGGTGRANEAVLLIADHIAGTLGTLGACGDFKIVASSCHCLSVDGGGEEDG